MLIPTWRMVDKVADATPTQRVSMLPMTVSVLGVAKKVIPRLTRQTIAMTYQ
mgnify:CR=1 FL=1